MAAGTPPGSVVAAGAECANRSRKLRCPVRLAVYLLGTVLEAGGKDLPKEWLTLEGSQILGKLNV